MASRYVKSGITTLKIDSPDKIDIKNDEFFKKYVNSDLMESYNIQKRLREEEEEEKYKKWQEEEPQRDWENSQSQKLIAQKIPFISDIAGGLISGVGNTFKGASTYGIDAGKVVSAGALAPLYLGLKNTKIGDSIKNTKLGTALNGVETGLRNGLNQMGNTMVEAGGSFNTKTPNQGAVSGFLKDASRGIGGLLPTLISPYVGVPQMVLSAAGESQQHAKDTGIQNDYAYGLKSGAINGAAIPLMALTGGGSKFIQGGLKGLAVNAGKGAVDMTALEGVNILTDTAFKDEYGNRITPDSAQEVASRLGNSALQGAFLSSAMSAPKLIKENIRIKSEKNIKAGENTSKFETKDGETVSKDIIDGLQEDGVPVEDIVNNKDVPSAITTEHIKEFYETVGYENTKEALKTSLEAGVMNHAEYYNHLKNLKSLHNETNPIKTKEELEKSVVETQEKLDSIVPKDELEQMVIEQSKKELNEIKIKAKNNEDFDVEQYNLAKKNLDNVIENYSKTVENNSQAMNEAKPSEQSSNIEKNRVISEDATDNLLPNIKNKNKAKYSHLSTEQQNRIYELENAHNEELARYRKQRNELTGTGIEEKRYEINKKIKGSKMVHWAEVRKTIQGDSLEPVEGGLTTKELQRKIDYLASNHLGKKVGTPKGDGEVVGNVYGKIKIKFEDGTIKTFSKEDISEPRNIAKNNQKVETIMDNSLIETPEIKNNIEQFEKVQASNENLENIIKKSKTKKPANEKFESIINSEDFKKSFPDFEGKIVKATTNTQKAISNIGNNLGREVVFYNSKTEIPKGFYSDGNVLYIRKTDTPANMLMKTTGHELFHSVKKNEPEVFTELMDYARENFTDKERGEFLDGLKHNKKLYDEYIEKPEALHEEMLSEQLGNNFTDSKFWEGIYKKDYSLFEKLRESVVKVFSKITKANNDSFLEKAHSDELFNRFQDMISKISKPDGEIIKAKIEEVKPVVEEVKPVIENEPVEEVKPIIEVKKPTPKVQTMLDTLNDMGYKTEPYHLNKYGDNTNITDEYHSFKVKRNKEELIVQLSNGGQGHIEVLISKLELHGFEKEPTDTLKGSWSLADPKLIPEYIDYVFRGKMSKEESSAIANDIARRDSEYFDNMNKNINTPEIQKKVKPVVEEVKPVENTEKPLTLLERARLDKLNNPEKYAKEEAIQQDRINAYNKDTKTYTLNEAQMNNLKEIPNKIKKEIGTAKENGQYIDSYGNLIYEFIDIDKNRYNIALNRDGKVSGIGRNYTKKGSSPIETIKKPSNTDTKFSAREENPKNILFEDVESAPENLRNNPLLPYVTNKKLTSFIENSVKKSERVSEESKNSFKSEEYTPISNKETWEQAQRKVDSDTNALNDFLSNTEVRTAEDTALGEALISKAIQENRISDANALSLNLAQKLTKAGQAVQAASIFKRLTPEGMLNYATKTIDNYNATVPPKKQIKMTDEFAKEIIEDMKRIEKMPDIQVKAEIKKGIEEIKNTQVKADVIEAVKNITDENSKVEITKEIKKIPDDKIREELLKIIEKITDERAKSEATQVVLKKITNQIPVGLLTKIDTFQTMAQLLNPKTSIRNIIGNAGMMLNENISNTIGTPIDIAVSKITGKRTVGLPSLTTQAKGFANGIKDGFRQTKLGIDGNLNSNTQFDLQNRQVYKNKGVGKILNYGQKVLDYMLRIPDQAARQSIIDDSLRIQKELNNVNKVKTPTEEMKIIAENDAKYGTFQDDTALSKSFSTIKKSLNLNKDFGLGSLILKYPKTPANILMRAIDYSPAGFFKATYRLAEPLIHGTEFNQRDFVKSTSRALYGTGSLIGTGYILGKMGIITGKQSDDKDTANMQNQIGLGSYKLNLSALKRFVLNGFDAEKAEIKEGDKIIDYDWIQPSSIGLAIGANAYDKKLDGTDVFSTVIESLGSGANTLAEQPLLSGLTNFFGNGRNDITSAFSTVLQGVPASMIPTILKQIATASDNTKRNTYDPSMLNKSMNQVKAKIPILSKTLQPKLDSLGNEQTQYEDNNLFNVFLNPAFSSTYNPKNAAKLPLDILKETGSDIAMPKQTSTFITDKGQKIKLTPQESTDFQKIVGERTATAIEKLKNAKPNEKTAKQIYDIIYKIQTEEKKKIITKKMKESLMDNLSKNKK